MVGFASSDRAYKAGPVAVLSPTHDPWGWPLATEHAAPSPGGGFLNRAVFRQPWAGVYIPLGAVPLGPGPHACCSCAWPRPCVGAAACCKPTEARSGFFKGWVCVLA